MRLPDFVIVGAMRSGTTTLSRVLRNIPCIEMASGKEVHFFDDQYSRGLNWYASLFAGLPEASMVGEATPNYMYDQAARDRLMADLPDAKFVAILRSPIDRAWSHYWFNVSRDKESLSFEEALEAEPSRLSASPFDRRVYSYVDRGRYADQLRPFVQEVGAERVHALYFEDLVAEPSVELAGLTRFLGAQSELDGNSHQDLPQVNRYVEFRSIWLRSLTKQLPRPLRRVVGRLNARTGVEYPSMPHRTRAMLREQLSDAVRQTAALVGREPIRWEDWY